MDMETNQLSVTISAKEGEKLTFEELTQASDDVIQRISKIKGIKTVGAMAGGDSTMNLMGGGNDSVSMYILLDEDSKVKASDVEEKIVSRTKDLDCKVETNSSSMDYSSYFGSGLSVRIKGNDIDTLQKLAKEVADVMKQTKGTVDVDDGLEDMEPQLTISVDKEKAAEYGYTVAQVYQLVSAKMADSKSATTISTDINAYKPVHKPCIRIPQLFLYPREMVSCAWSSFQTIVHIHGSLCLLHHIRHFFGKLLQRINIISFNSDGKTAAEITAVIHGRTVGFYFAVQIFRPADNFFFHIRCFDFGVLIQQDIHADAVISSTHQIHRGISTSHRSDRLDSFDF